MTKTFRISDWSIWLDICETLDEDPWTTDETGYDCGGGDSINYEFTGDRPERENEQ